MTNRKEEEEEDGLYKFRSTICHFFFFYTSTENINYVSGDLLISSFPVSEKGIPLLIPTRKNSSSIKTDQKERAKFHPK